MEVAKSWRDVSRRMRSIQRRPRMRSLNLSQLSNVTIHSYDIDHKMKNLPAMVPAPTGVFEKS